jgi:hypothetical protein
MGVRIRTPPPPHPAGSGGGGAHSLTGEGLGIPIRTRGKTPWYSKYICTLCPRPKSRTLSKARPSHELKDIRSKQTVKGKTVPEEAHSIIVLFLCSKTIFHHLRKQRRPLPSLLVFLLPVLPNMPRILPFTLVPLRKLVNHF